MSDLYEELQALIGKEGPQLVGLDEVCRPMIRHWCEAIEDTNPLFCDEEYASKSKYLGIIAPPTMVLAFAQRPLWPDGQEMQYRATNKETGAELLMPHEVALQKCDQAGFTGMLVVNIVQEFFNPLCLGDRVSKSSKLHSVTKEKKTVLGRSHFLNTVFSYKNQRGDLICEQTYTICRFKPQE